MGLNQELANRRHWPNTQTGEKEVEFWSKRKVTSQIKGQNSVHYGCQTREQLCWMGTFPLFPCSWDFCLLLWALRTGDPTSELMFSKKQMWCSTQGLQLDAGPLVSGDNSGGLETSTEANRLLEWPILTSCFLGFYYFTFLTWTHFIWGEQYRRFSMVEKVKVFFLYLGR